MTYGSPGTKIYPPGRSMKCGHPYAARKVTVTGNGIKTVCWACEVEREISERR